MIHEALLVAVREQPDVPLTDTLTVPPEALTLALEDPRLKLHGAAACETVKVLPAMVSVPERDVPAVLAATL